jgi:hypothetical protein
VLLGQDQPATRWLLPARHQSTPAPLPDWEGPGYPAPPAPPATVEVGQGGVPRSGQVWLQVVDTGARPASLKVQALISGHVVALGGGAKLIVGAGQRTGFELAPAVAGQALVVASSQPVLVEEDSYAVPPSRGVNLCPGVLVGPLSAK